MLKTSTTTKGSSEDIWTKIEKISPKIENNENYNTNSSIIFVGDQGSGKTYLIQTFLKPNINVKDPKPTIAIDYNFARRVNNNVKQIANIWELGGDLIEPKLFEIGLNKSNIITTTVVLCVDLSKPQNILNSFLKNIKLLQETISKKLIEMKVTNSNIVNDVKANSTNYLKDHKDFVKVKPFDLNLIVIGTKFDSFKSLQSAERRAAIQVLRFASHYYGATLITTSLSDSTAKESFRSLLTTICFNSTPKVFFETNSDKFVYISKGQDSFENILLDSKAMSSEASKHRLVSSESDVELFVSAKGLTKDCWNRMLTHLVSIFGTPDSSLSENSQIESSDNNNNNDNPYPETEIDDIRALKDNDLIRFIQENERKEQLNAKLNN